MRSDAITIYGDLTGREEALDTAERFVSYNKLSGKDAMHLRLLTEEAICLVHGVMAGIEGKLWLESEKQDDTLICRICLTANDNVTESQENKLLSVSTSGTNENAKGILGKIRELIRISAQHHPIVNFDEVNAEDTFDDWYYMGVPHSESRMIDDYYVGYWSLDIYRKTLKESQPQSSEQWDELEKSIISNLADDVKVWLKNDTTEVVIEKRFS